jgi:hypothetical protein
MVNESKNILLLNIKTEGKLEQEMKRIIKPQSKRINPNQHDGT